MKKRTTGYHITIIPLWC